MVFASRDNPDNTIWPKLIVTYVAPSSVKNNNNNYDHVSVYPNPTNSWVNIDFKRNINKNITLKLFNIQGMLIKSTEYKSSEKIKLDLSNLSKGSYIIQITSDNHTYTVEKIFVE